MKTLGLLMLLSLIATRADALDSVYVEYGRADATIISSPARAKLYRIGGTWGWNRSWLNNGDWHVTGYWDVALGQWHGQMTGVDNQTVTDFGITPVFRLAPKEAGSVTPYFEAGILGLHLISPTYIYPGRQFSTAFQFGHFVGFGISLGTHRDFELGFRFQHVSNADIKLPNPGMDFDLLHLDYRF